MSEFFRICQKLDELKTANADEDAPLLDSGEESPAMRAIRNGQNIGDSFWDDFLTLINDSDALSELLEIPKEKITGWATRIKEMQEKVGKHDDQNGDSPSELVPTGNEPTADPAGNDSMADGPAETRPGYA